MDVKTCLALSRDRWFNVQILLCTQSTLNFPPRLHFLKLFLVMFDKNTMFIHPFTRNNPRESMKHIHSHKYFLLSSILATSENGHVSFFTPLKSQNLYNLCLGSRIPSTRNSKWLLISFTTNLSSQNLTFLLLYVSYVTYNIFSLRCGAW
jgi:hypothetical protein